MKHILARIAKSQIEEEDGNTPMVGTQFSKETRVRDEDEEMKKFIEAEMEKRRGKNLNMEYKAGSLQEFVPSIGPIENFSPDLFSADEIHKIAVLDIRLLNLD